MRHRRYKNNILKTALLAVLIVMTAAVPMNARQQNKKSVKELNMNTSGLLFSMPADVVKSGEKELLESLREGRPVETIQALTAITIAKDLISRENAPAQIKMIDSIGRTLPDPYKSIALLLEANLYNEIKHSTRTTARIVDESMSSENPQFWDQRMFRTKIYSLVKEILDSSESAKSISLDRISKIVAYNSNDVYPLALSDFTIYDFLVHGCMTLLTDNATATVIPFFTSESGSDFTPLSLAQLLVENNTKPSYTRSWAILVKYSKLPTNNKKEYLWNEIQKMGNSRYAVPLIARYFSDYINTGEKYDESYVQFYRYVEALKNKTGKKEDVDILSDFLRRMTQERASLQFDTPPITGEANKAMAKGWNLNRFYILIYKAKSPNDNDVKISDLKKGYTLAKTVSVDLGAAEKPSLQEKEINITVDEAGKYFVVFSETDNISHSIEKENNTAGSFIVSDIDLMKYYDHNKGTTGVYVVRSSDSSPLSGIPVKFEEWTSYYNKKNANIKTVTTDSTGYAPAPFERTDAIINYKGNLERISLSSYRYDEPVTNTHVKILTDLAVYRPGDKVQFCGIIYSSSWKSAELKEESEITVKLLNANLEEVEIKKLDSDRSGRFFGEFDLPKEGLLGTWYIQAEGLGIQQFSVEEYKLPSFYITLEKKEAGADHIEFEGYARTYSGMPLGGIDINYHINYIPFRNWWVENSGSNYSGKSKTDGEGRFTINLPLGNLPKEYYYGLFNIMASGTDQAGETMTSPIRAFFIKETLNINPVFDRIIELRDSDPELNVRVTDQANLPVIRDVNYKITTESGELVDEGTFTSPTLRLDSSKIASGAYKFQFYIDEIPNDPSISEKEVIFYREDDETPPFETALWLPQKEILVDNGVKEIDVTFGSSSTGQHVLCVISNSSGELKIEWIKTDGRNHRLSVGAPEEDQRVFVNFSTFYRHKLYEQTVTLIPKAQREVTQIEVATFRDALSAGDTEQWKFRLRKGDRTEQSYGMAVMYDKALDAIAPLSWHLPNFMARYPNYYDIGANSRFTPGMSAYRSAIYRYVPLLNVNIRLNTWDQHLYGSNYSTSVSYAKLASKTKAKSSSARSRSAARPETSDAEEENFMMADMAAPVAVAAEEAADTGAAVAEGTADETDEANQETYRMAEMPLAFFKPDITSNPDGELVVDFKVPDFNTTWKFMLGAYTPDLTSATTSLETVVSKKVMVKMLYPRFIRTGDRVVLTATLYNNSDQTLPLGGKIELFDPLTGELLVRTDVAAENVIASGNRVISIEYDCPSAVNAVGMRAYAASCGNSDGEQTVIPVLPSTQPVIESTTFYASPGQNAVEVNLPSYPEGSRLTLTYCDNPLWEVLTALAPISTPDSETLIPNVYALYANSVGYGILKNNPSLHEGLEMIVNGEAGDSLLISNLEKNQDLKTVLLGNTPWVNDAKSETLRMSRLGTLLHDEEAMKAITTNWERIMRLRNPDGGWSWFDGCKSSRWMTEAVLINLALLRQGGYFQDLPQIESAISGGVKFCDQEILENYAKYEDKKHFPYLSLRSYLFIRSFFPESKTDPTLAGIKKKALDAIESKWSEASIFDKATDAILLWREGRKKTAGLILESLRQFASYSPEKGMWYDNLESTWGGANKMLTTARVLTAFATIAPDDESVDRLRQWMLLQRQTQDWHEGLFSLDAIDALLTTGQHWDGKYAKPSISLGGKEIGTSRVSELTGSCTVDITLAEAAGKCLRIERDAPGPAWGGIISQYVAPMQTVAAAEIPELKIEKRYWKLVTQSDGSVKAEESETLSVGDKVRIALIVTCDRDMDFVALTDERASCLEPVARVSGYTVIDGVWAYREIRNSATNIFFPFLAKGRHIFYYDCAVQEAGEFAAGIATLQCLYSPVMTAHSSGEVLKVK